VCPGGAASILMGLLGLTAVQYSLSYIDGCAKKALMSSAGACDTTFVWKACLLVYVYERVLHSLWGALRGITDPTVSCSPTNLCLCMYIL
jgi:hypothetical protein